MSKSITKTQTPSVHTMTTHRLNLAIKAALFGVAVLPLSVWAQENTQTDANSDAKDTKTPVVYLDAITVTAAPSAPVSRFDTDVTGLGKTVKTADTLAKEQVQGIRDLVRYETGVSVVEQGRGGSSGFAIHGVDKNRVGITVDGIAQIQSYKDESTKRAGAGSGAMNEIEIENIAAVAINKGGNALEAGSGALGGSVAFHTKDVGDVLKSGKNLGAQSKTTYNSKNDHFSQTLAAAGKTERVEAMVQYTYRKGKENKAHSDLNGINQSLYRLGAWQQKYDLRKPNELFAGTSYITESCLASDDPKNCVQYPYVYTKALPDGIGNRNFSELNDAEKAQYLASMHPHEVVSAKDYTGTYRLLPDPMDYRSDSYLARLNIKITPNLVSKLLLEDTKQTYNIRDMRHCSYHGARLGNDGKPANGGSIVLCDDYQEYLNANDASQASFRPGANDAPIPKLAYARSSVFNQEHGKTRYGLGFEFKPDTPWFKQAKLNLHQQNIQIINHDIKKSCSQYPKVDLNCGISEIGHYEYQNNYRYKEGRTSLTGKLDFNFDLLGQHDLTVLAGADKVKSQFRANNPRRTIIDTTQGDAIIDESTLTAQEQAKFKQSGAAWIVKNRLGRLEEKDACGNANECERAPIHGSNQYVGINNLYTPNDYVDLSFGGRLDKQRIHSTDSNIINKTYTNKSYNFGAAVHLTPDFSLLYKTAKGFRTPSFYELYNYNSTAAQHKNDPDVSFPKRAVDVKPETSNTNEYGFRYQHPWGDIEVSMFKSRYKDMLDKAIPNLTKAQQEYCKAHLDSNECVGNPPTPKTSDEVFANLYNATIKGVSVKGKLDLHAMTSKLPDGLEMTLGYGHTKLGKFDYIAPKDADGWYQARPAFWDAITPARYVVGLNYDHPSQVWGIGTTLTHSKQKDENELSALRIRNGKRETQTLTRTIPKAYTLIDMTGYYSPTESITARLGINNVLNTRYTTWEAARQLPSEAASSTQSTRYIAPGRSYFASLEMKF